jgi:hypothetical protein
MKKCKINQSIKIIKSTECDLNMLMYKETQINCIQMSICIPRIFKEILNNKHVTDKILYDNNIPIILVNCLNTEKYQKCFEYLLNNKKCVNYLNHSDYEINVFIQTLCKNEVMAKQIINSKYFNKKTLNCHNPSNWNCLMLSCVYSPTVTKDILKYCDEKYLLQTTDNNYNCLMIASEYFNNSAIDIIDNNIGIEQLLKKKNTNGHNAFNRACHFNNTDIIKKILTLDISFNIISPININDLIELIMTNKCADIFIECNRTDINELKNILLNKTNQSLFKKLALNNSLNDIDINNINEMIVNNSIDQECSICYDKKISLVFNPCGHMACNICSLKIDKCHLCKEYINGRIILHA